MGDHQVPARNQRSPDSRRKLGRQCVCVDTHCKILPHGLENDAYEHIPSVSVVPTESSDGPYIKSRRNSRCDVLSTTLSSYNGRGKFGGYGLLIPRGKISNCETSKDGIRTASITTRDTKRLRVLTAHLRWLVIKIDIQICIKREPKWQSRALNWSHVVHHHFEKQDAVGPDEVDEAVRPGICQNTAAGHLLSHVFEALRCRGISILEAGSLLEALPPPTHWLESSTQTYFPGTSGLRVPERRHLRLRDVSFPSYYPS